MITIHHIEGRRSERVAWLLEEIGGIPYKLEFIQGDVPGSLLRLEPVHEMRMTPIVQDGDLTIIESGAILEYLLSKYGKDSPLRPREGTAEFAHYLEFMHFAEGSAMARIVLDLMLSRMGGTDPMPKLPGLAGSRTQSERVMYFADNVLGTRRYFAGDRFTAADIMMHFPLKLGAAIASKAPVVIADVYRTDHAYYDRFPNVKRFMKEVMERPAWKRTVETTLPIGPPSM
ncbi:MAG: glutathione S-transferase family protein [bacterium]